MSRNASPFGRREEQGHDQSQENIIDRSAPHSPGGHQGRGSLLKRFSIIADVEKGVMSTDALKSPIEIENARIASIKRQKRNAQEIAVQNVLKKYQTKHLPPEEQARIRKN